MFKCQACTYESNYKDNLQRHFANMHEGVRFPCSLCPKRFNVVCSLTRHMRNVHGVVTNLKPYQKQIAAQNNDEDNVLRKIVRHLCDLCNSTFHNRSNLSRHIKHTHGINAYNRLFKKNVTGQDRVRHSCSFCTSTFIYRCSLTRHIRIIHGIDKNHSMYKSQVTTKENVPDIPSESDIIHISLDSEDGEISTKPLNEGIDKNHSMYKSQVTTKENVPDIPSESDIIHITSDSEDGEISTKPLNEGIDKNHSMYKSQVTTKENVPDIPSESDIIHISSDSEDGEICTKPLNEGIDKNHSMYKSQVTTKENVPDIPSESDIIHISSDSEDGEICTKPLNEDSTAVNIQKTPIDNSVGNKTTFNLHPHNPLGVVRQNEYLRKGTKNQSFSTPKKRSILRKLYEEYVKVENVQDRRLAWVSHATSLSEKLNLELRVIGLLMLEIPSDFSTPIDENLIQMLYQDSLICMENIQHHTQYYIFMQLIYGLMKVYGINSKDLQRHRKSNWMKNTITILKYFKFTDDTADFMIERMKNFI